MIDLWEKRFEIIRRLGWAALVGLLCVLAAVMTTGAWQKFFIVLSLVLILPLCLYLYIFVIWHWKSRYRGKHSDLWGALILIETSGWMKIVYMLRHVIPDMYKVGRYAPEPISLEIQQ